VNPIAVLRRVSIKNLLKGILLGLGHPLLIWPTIKATRECVRISTAHYGKLHHKNGPANAFRHALWNFMIARACRRYSGEQRALSWAGKITHWHEDSFPNGKLARAMDLHNNAVGRDLLGEHRDRQLEEVIEILKGMALESVKVDVHANLGTLKYQLVHIMEP